MYDSRRRLLKAGAGSMLACLSTTAAPASLPPTSAVSDSLPSRTAAPGSLSSTTAAAGTPASAREPDAVFTSDAYQPGLLLHIVLFKYKAEVTAEQKLEVQRRFLALGGSKRAGAASAYILSITSGSQNSLEGVGQGYEQGYTVAFKSAGDRNYYVGKPVVTDQAYFDSRHDEFKAYVGPLLAPQGGVLVFDYAVEAQA
ncbi:Dabb family protein [Achromobacter aloeverae]|nr:Dabb family protein [Achromobacter aloeverae]